MRVALALAILLAPGFAIGESVGERNLAFLWSLLGDADPATPATLHDGRSVTLAAAVQEAAARARDADLAALASGAAPPGEEVHAGDVWVLELGNGPCTPIVLAPGSPIVPPLDPQTWLYYGATGTLSTEHGFYTFILGWTMKTSEIQYGSPGFLALGIQDFYCVYFNGLHFAFPFIDGTARVNQEGDP